MNPKRRPFFLLPIRTLYVCRSSANQGAALVIVLTFLMLLTGMVVAYFSFVSLQGQISNTSTKRSLASIFAEGALKTTITDLKNEITDSSRSSISYCGTNRVFYPSSPDYLLPSRVGTSTNLPNLVKRSAYEIAFYKAAAGQIGEDGPNRASMVSTTQKSKNGRFWSASRWNIPLLLPKQNTNDTVNLTPIHDFIPPDWILVARDGSNPQEWSDSMRWSTTHPKTVLGRYAYTIYDEGGILDANVAGYPTSTSTNNAMDKGGLAFADLSVIPGMSPNAINALVGWRNYATTHPNGNFPSYKFEPESLTNYFDLVRNVTSGFLRTSNTNLYQKQTDRMFTSRQQLIKFLTEGVANGEDEKAALQNALQYLGTFTRDIEQPSFRPDPNRPKNTTHKLLGPSPGSNTPPGTGGNDTYDPLGKKQDLINPWFLTATHPDGTPVVKRRFPLSRLKLVATETAESTDPQKVYDYFGLTWNKTNHRWSYNHGSNKILMLSEIPSNREPDFFELLKAAIHCDSLGKQFGATGSSKSIHIFGVGTSSAPGVDGVIDFQIIQIGANIIDQYDEDSYPTAIDIYDAANIVLGKKRVFYGVENLPYIAGWMQSWYRMYHLNAADIQAAKQPPSASAPFAGNYYPYESWVLYQPIIWNPHTYDSSLNTSKVPVNFRVSPGMRDTGAPITIYPQTRPAWWTVNWVSIYPANPINTTLTWAESTLDPTVSAITFNATPNTSPQVDASFQEPYKLLYHSPAGSNADTMDPDGKISLDTYGSIIDSKMATYDAPVDGKTVIGFFGGKCWSGPYQSLVTSPPSNPGPLHSNCLSAGISSTDDVQLSLQYKSPSGQWLTYDLISETYCSSSSESLLSTIDHGESTPTNTRAYLTSWRADPRTDRWGAFIVKTFPTAAAPSGYATPPATDIFAGTVYPFIQGSTLSPNSGINQGFIYKLTGGGTLAEGWSGSGTIVGISDLSVNINTGTTAGATAYIPGGKHYYDDPDHVLRRASGAYFKQKSNFGLPFYTANYNSRPKILNRPFRSIVELGYVFRGQAWKDLDFVFPESGDSALLDIFCLNELDNAPEHVIAAGKINLNTLQEKPLEALIRGSSKAEGGILSNEESEKIAQALCHWTSDDPSSSTNKYNGIFYAGPLLNRSELVGKFVAKTTYISPNTSNGPRIGYLGSLSYFGFSSILNSITAKGVFSNDEDACIKRRRECALRALLDAGNTRTWNLMIDLVGQVGHYSSEANSLSEFESEGEIRIWAHLAIDRFTGKIVDQSIEYVNDQ